MGMKLIPLTGKYGQGLFAKVDDDIYDRLMLHKWHGKIDKWGNIIAATEIKGKTIRMSRFVISATNPRIFVDHIDHDILNNQKSNLRESTPMQNAKNRNSRRGSSSKFLGVCKTHKNIDGKRIPQYISAQIRVDKKLIHLGCFPLTPCGEILAALTYDEAAIKYHGEFANPNFK